MADEEQERRLRRIEWEIDREHCSNELLSLDRATALWNLLSVAEDYALAPFLHADSLSFRQLQAKNDNLVNLLKIAVRWVHCKTKPAGGLDDSFVDDRYGHAADLIKMASSYLLFEAAFTTWSAGMVDLTVRGDRILPDDSAREGLAYEAYSLLRRSDSSPINPMPDAVKRAIKRSVHVKGDRFRITLNRKLVNCVLESLNESMCHEFTLPDTWRFARYSISDLKRFCSVCKALATIHLIGRIHAAHVGCRSLGYRSAVLLCHRDTLVRRFADYASLDVTTTSALIEDLTYGKRGIKRPDPALQPFIELSENVLAIAPSLLLWRSSERNHCTLLNRMPEERLLYSQLTLEKEAIMVGELGNSAQSRRFRIVSGSVPGRDDLPDIDLAIVSDAERCAVIVEAKWFIFPSEPREWIEKGAELTKGVSQVLKLTRAIKEGCNGSLTKLGIDSSYTVMPVVASKNWIGFLGTQHPDVPIVESSHLATKVADVEKLSSVVDWLRSRRYLPVEGRDFRAGSQVEQIGRWVVEWPGWKLLRSEHYCPL